MSGNTLQAAQTLAHLIRQRYDQCPPGKWPTEDSLAEFILEHANGVGLAVVELPEAHFIEVVEIDCDHPDYAPDARLTIRFSGVPRPGRLFNHVELAAALLAEASSAAVES